MLLKKKTFKKKQLIIKYIFKKNELRYIINKSLLKNHYNSFIFRLSFTVNILSNSPEYFFKSRQKLICLNTLDKKVPSKHFLFSRFFLNKELNSLKINNTSK